MYRSKKIALLILFTLSLLQWAVGAIWAAGPTVDHRFFLELPNGTKRQLEMKGAKIHKSIIMRSSNGDPGNGRVVQDLCRYPENGDLQRRISAGYHCATNESCFNEDIGAPYLPVSFNSPSKVSSLPDASYMQYYNETFTTMLAREAPYLVPLYDPTSIRGFAGAKWIGHVDWAVGNGGFQIMYSGTENPHGNEPLIRNSQPWSTVYGYSAPQSWGPGEVYRNPQGGNILQGKVSWVLVAPDTVTPRRPTAGFSGACKQLSCPAESSYYFKVINIEPADITSEYTRAAFMLSFYGNSWSTAQKNSIKNFLGTPTFTGSGTDFAYTLGVVSEIKSENGKPMIDFNWTGGSAIGTGGRTLNDLINWTEQQKAEGIAVPNYSIAANLTIDGGQTQNDYVGGTSLSLLRNECESCGSAEKPTGTIGGAIIACTATAPQTYRYYIDKIDLKGNEFASINFFLRFQYNTNTAKLIGTTTQAGFLGTPQFSQWVNENRSQPREGDWFLYTLKSYTQYSGEGSVSFVWDDSVTFGNGKNLSQLITFAQANSLGTYAIVGANIQVKRAGVLMQNDWVGGVLTEFKAACPGNQCPIDEQGPPNAPVIVTPSNLETTIPVNALNQFTLSWKQINPNNGKGKVVDEYIVLIYKSDAYGSPESAEAALNAVDYENGELPPADIIRIWQNANTTNYDATYSKLITIPPAMGNNITIAIRSLNNRPIECTTGGAAVTQSSWTAHPDIELTAEFGGNFYKSASCNLATAEPISLSGSSFVSVVKDSNGQEYTTPANGSTYKLSIPPGTADYFPKLKFDQAGQPEALLCSSCNPDLGDGFCSRGRTQGPTANAHFFLESYNLNFDSWWQTRSGLVYGHSGVSSTLPIESEDCQESGDYCKPFLVRKSLTDDELSAGIPMTFNDFSGVGSYWTDRAGGAHADSGADNKTRVVKENYGYFVSKIEMPPQDITTDNIDSLGDIPAGTEIKGARVSFRDGNLSFRPDQTWVVPNGQKRVIFVNGNLTISQPTDQPVTTVEEGGFLTFIVSGSITIDATVGHENPDEITPNTSLQANLEGIFVADGSLRILSRGSDDRKFVGAGSFIGWSGAELNRTFDNGALGRFRNTTTPTETFIFRPDLVVNTPDVLKFTDLIWQEVN